MTPAQLEHLKLIDVHLERLLAIAEKRTAGRWIIGAGRYLVGLDCDTVEIAEFSKDDDWEIEQRSNMKFIASCAGNAESGWRATRAAIALLFAMCDGAHSINTVIAAQKMGESILAAFPLELIQKP